MSQKPYGTFLLILLTVHTLAIYSWNLSQPLSAFVAVSSVLSVSIKNLFSLPILSNISYINTSTLVGSNYGLWVYLIYAFFLILWRSCTWNNETACPYRPLEDVLEYNIDLSDAIGLIIFQLAGGILANRLMIKFWRLNLSTMHTGLHKGDCSNEINVNHFSFSRYFNVFHLYFVLFQGPLALAFVAEGVGTFLGRVVSRKLNECQLKPVVYIVDALFSLLLMLAGNIISNNITFESKVKIRNCLVSEKKRKLSRFKQVVFLSYFQV